MKMCQNTTENNRPISFIITYHNFHLDTMFFISYHNRHLDIMSVCSCWSSHCNVLT